MLVPSLYQTPQYTNGDDSCQAGSCSTAVTAMAESDGE